MTKSHTGRWLLAIVAVVAASTCVGLGLWQLDRLEGRQARNDAVSSRTALPVLDQTADLAAPDALFRRVRLEGTFDFERETIVLGRPVNGVPGVFVVTPLVTPDGRAVLVERGWTPSPDARSIAVDALREPAPAVVRGVVMEPQPAGMSLGDGWPLRVRGVDPVELQDRFPYRLAAVVRRTDDPPASLASVVSPIRLPQLSSGPHLGYAFQWFSFAVVIVAGTVILLRKDLRRARGEPLDLPETRY